MNTTNAWLPSLPTCFPARLPDSRLSELVVVVYSTTDSDDPRDRFVTLAGLLFNEDGTPRSWNYEGWFYAPFIPTDHADYRVLYWMPLPPLPT